MFSGHLSMRSRTRRRNCSLSSACPSAVCTSSRRVLGPMRLTSTCPAADRCCAHGRFGCVIHCCRAPAGNSLPSWQQGESVRSTEHTTRGWLALRWAPPSSSEPSSIVPRMTAMRRGFGALFASSTAACRPTVSLHISLYDSHNRCEGMPSAA